MIRQLAAPGYEARIERSMILRVEAFDWNCTQNIRERFTFEEITAINRPLYEHAERLEAENRRLRVLPER